LVEIPEKEQEQLKQQHDIEPESRKNIDNYTYTIQK